MLNKDCRPIGRFAVYLNGPTPIELHPLLEVGVPLVVLVETSQPTGELIPVEQKSSWVVAVKKSHALYRSIIDETPFSCRPLGSFVTVFFPHLASSLSHFFLRAFSFRNTGARAFS